MTQLRMILAASAALCVASVSSTAPAEVTVIEGVRQPFSLVFDSDGGAYGVEYEEGNRVFRLADGQLTFIAGRSGGAGNRKGDVAEGDGEHASKGRFNGMHDLAWRNDGRLWIADTFNHRIRSIDLDTMRLETFAGAGGKGAFHGGDAKTARFNGPFTVALAPDGKRLLVADLGNRRVREIDLASRAIRTVAGNGERGVPEDGAIATGAPLLAPRAAIYGADGTVFIASREGHALRHVGTDGRIRTVVNTKGAKGYAGDGGPGRDARLSGPKHLCLDPNGDVVIADDQNHCIRLYRVADGTIGLLAGMPPKSGRRVGDGPLDTQLNRPHGARYDAKGRLWVCDSSNLRILCFERADSK